MGIVYLGGDIRNIYILSLLAFSFGTDTDIDGSDQNIFTFLFGEGILGCTDSGACNYDETATEDDGSCEYNDNCDVCGGNNDTCTETSSQMAAYYFSSIT